MKLTEEEKGILNKGYEDLYKNFDLEDFEYELANVKVHLEKNKENIIYLENKIRQLKLEKDLILHEENTNHYDNNDDIDKYLGVV